MDFVNIDPMLGQTLTQIVHLKEQIVMVKSVDTSKFVAAITEFANLLGVEMANQATGKSAWISPNAVVPPNHVDMSAAALEQTLAQGG